MHHMRILFGSYEVLLREQTFRYGCHVEYCSFSVRACNIDEHVVFTAYCSRSYCSALARVDEIDTN